VPERSVAGEPRLAWLLIGADRRSIAWPFTYLAGGVATATVLGAIVASIAARRALRGVPD
jgi:cell division protein FtsX